MWNTNSLWFEVAVVTSLTAVEGFQMLLSEERTPKWRKIIKLIFFVFVTTLISATAGRTWAMNSPGPILLFVVYIHAIWLPRKGINGWTGEPREKYYD